MDWWSTIKRDFTKKINKFRAAKSKSFERKTKAKTIKNISSCQSVLTRIEISNLNSFFLKFFSCYIIRCSWNLDLILLRRMIAGTKSFQYFYQGRRNSFLFSKTFFINEDNGNAGYFPVCRCESVEKQKCSVAPWIFFSFFTSFVIKFMPTSVYTYQMKSKERLLNPRRFLSSLSI